MEALCNLLTTVGKEMDGVPKLPKQMMDMYFARLDVLARSRTASTRASGSCAATSSSSAARTGCPA